MCTSDPEDVRTKCSNGRMSERFAEPRRSAKDACSPASGLAGLSCSSPDPGPKIGETENSRRTSGSSRACGQDGRGHANARQTARIEPVVESHDFPTAEIIHDAPDGRASLLSSCLISEVDSPMCSALSALLRAFAPRALRASTPLHGAASVYIEIVRQRRRYIEPSFGKPRCIIKPKAVVAHPPQPSPNSRSIRHLGFFFCL